MTQEMGSVSVTNVERTLVSVAPAIVPALVHDCSRTSAETSLGAADTSVRATFVIGQYAPFANSTARTVSARMCKSSQIDQLRM